MAMICDNNLAVTGPDDELQELDQWLDAQRHSDAPDGTAAALYNIWDALDSAKGIGNCSSGAPLATAGDSSHEHASGTILAQWQSKNNPTLDVVRALSAQWPGLRFSMGYRGEGSETVGGVNCHVGRFTHNLHLSGQEEIQDHLFETFFEDVLRQVDEPKSIFPTRSFRAALTNEGGLKHGGLQFLQTSEDVFVVSGEMEFTVKYDDDAYPEWSLEGLSSDPLGSGEPGLEDLADIIINGEAWSTEEQSTDDTDDESPFDDDSDESPFDDDSDESPFDDDVDDESPL